jgi:hypothetical protein
MKPQCAQTARSRSSPGGVVIVNFWPRSGVADMWSSLAPTAPRLWGGLNIRRRRNHSAGAHFPMDGR